MRIGIFGGAFNPVHNGHLHLMEEICRFSQIDKLLLIPTANPPHKTGEDFADAADRFNMLSLAVSSRDNFSFDIRDKIEISDIEFTLEGKSYTYNTLKKLKEIYPDDMFVLMMGSDQLFSFKSWYKYESILKLACISAVTREELERERVGQFLADNKTIFPDGSVEVLTANPVVVSATEIRDRVRNNESIAYLVPPEVEKYIFEKGLYSV